MPSLVGSQGRFGRPVSTGRRTGTESRQVGLGIGGLTGYRRTVRGEVELDFYRTVKEEEKRQRRTRVEGKRGEQGLE